MLVFDCALEALTVESGKGGFCCGWLVDGLASGLAFGCLVGWWDGFCIGIWLSVWLVGWYLVVRSACGGVREGKPWTDETGAVLL